MSSENLRVALATAAAGDFVFPAIVTWNEAAKKLDKRPAISGWREAASRDPEQIKKWFAPFSEAVPGIELGRSGLFAIDLDRHPGGADGITNFKAFRGDNPVPQCPTTKTPSGGWHLYFKQPESERLGNRTGTLPAGVDCRGDGGWTVAPGAVFGQWRWIGDPTKLATAPPVPTWIVSAIQARKATEYTAGPSPADAGKRERAYAEAALTNAANKVAASQRGHRNAELNTAAFCMGTMIARGWIGRATVEGRLHDAAMACGYIADDGETAVHSTIKSGIDAGIKEPHEDLKERDRSKDNGAGAGASTDQKTIDALAQLSGLAYQKRRLQEAKTLGIPVAALDKLVRQAKVRAEDNSAELPHWKVKPWDEPVDGAGLLADIERVFVRYVFLPMGASVALALWTLHAWTMDAGDISPFIVLVSPTKRCGKTTVLIILSYLTPRAELASNISSSALFRYVEEIRPTLLIDEADSFVKDNEELRGILNSGHTKAAAYLAGGDWPKKAQDAALVLSGEEVSTFNVDLLADIRAAFGEAEIITSADLVAALVADPERPWATWGKGDKPLTQNGLARLLKPFAIISDTVHPAGRPHAKGYKRVWFEDAWASYLSGQNPSAQQIPDSKACKRASADETGIIRDFQSVQKELRHALKNAGLSYGHAGLHVSTVENQESGGEGDSATTKPLPYDPGPIPDCLRRTAPSGGNGARVPNDVDAVYEELSARGEQAPWRPRGRGWHVVGDLPRQEAGAIVFLKERWVPALSSGPDDDVFDMIQGGGNERA